MSNHEDGCAGKASGGLDEGSYNYKGHVTYRRVCDK